MVDPFIEGRTNPHCTIVTLMMWIIMIKAQSTHELVLGYTRPNRSNRSNRSRHPVNERQFRKILPRTRMCSYYFEVGSSKIGEAVRGRGLIYYYKALSRFTICTTIANRMRGPPGRLVLPLDSTETLCKRE